MNRSGTLSLILFAALVLSVDVAMAQRNTASSYQALLMRTRQANAYVDANAFPLPGRSDTLELATTFRIEYDYLTFTRSEAAERPGGQGDAEFASSATVFVDLYKAGANIPQQIERSEAGMMAGRGARRPNVPNAAAANASALLSDAWRGTAYAKNYAQTISNRHYLEGQVRMLVPPGEYDVVISLRPENQARDRAIARARVVIASPEGTSGRIPMAIVKPASIHSDLEILGFGNQVPYGSDFDVLVPVAGDTPAQNLSLVVRQLEFGRRDTTTKAELARIAVTPDMFFSAELSFGDSTYAIQRKPGERRWLRIPVSASRFPNTPFRLELTSEGRTTPVATRMVQSKWVDIPTSLLNVSVAIDMMENLLDKDEYRRVRRLNAAEKEKYFKDYWNPKDPTPGTEYNELMVEYYRRVDIAYERFSSATTPGYATDQGKTFMLMGEPDRITRRFPPDQPAIEIWEYGTRQVVFQATSGFGDFQLVNTGQ